MNQSPTRYLVTAALPYANGPLHIGHLAGAYLSADLCSRFLRLQGKEVVFVCGSDEHGAAITIKAKKEGISNDISVQTKGLTNLDLYHFGWNIWNQFRPIKQEDVSKLLKNVFVSLDDIDLESIKSHLKDEPKKGIIKIQENLTDYQKT